MILGSHNSWSYSKPKCWWMRPFSFTCKCQSKDIVTQYEKYGVRCFDLRLRYIDGVAHVVHNNMDYGRFWGEKSKVFDMFNEKGDVTIRVLHDVRTEKLYTPQNVKRFRDDCEKLMAMYPNVKFCSGENLYDYKEDFHFDYKPNTVEKYSSVCPPRIIDDWFPFIYAFISNRKIYKEYKIDGDDSCVLFIDFVNVGRK